jgi:hypothetical protein
MSALYVRNELISQAYNKRIGSLINVWFPLKCIMQFADDVYKPTMVP